MRINPKMAVVGVLAVVGAVLIGFLIGRSSSSEDVSATTLVGAGETTVVTEPSTTKAVTTTSSTSMPTTTVATTTTVTAPPVTLLREPGHGVAVGGYLCEAVWVEDHWLQDAIFSETGFPMPPEATCFNESGVTPCKERVYATWGVWQPTVTPRNPTSADYETARTLMPDAEKLYVVGTWNVDLNNDGYAEVLGLFGEHQFDPDQMTSPYDEYRESYFIRMYHEGEHYVFNLGYGGIPSTIFDVNGDGFAEILMDIWANYPVAYTFSDLEFDFVILETSGCKPCLAEDCDW